MAKLEIPIIVNCTEIDELIDEIKHLQTYKLFEGDEQVLIDRDDAIEIFAKHIRASAQPEPLTDKEQRIFLAAMGREEKICKKTDEECRNCREPYEDSLVYVCKEIVRKVKGALWQT